MRGHASALLTAALVVGFAVPAGAAPPERERFVEDVSEAEEPVRYDCEGTILTETEGYIVGWSRMQPKKDGTTQVHWQARADGLTAEDDEGRTYRIVGSGGGVAWYPQGADPMEDDEPQRGHFGLRLNILDQDGGLLGRVFVRGQITRQGEFRWLERGDCVEL
jgi:hypothetical protein